LNETFYTKYPDYAYRPPWKRRRTDGSANRHKGPHENRLPFVPPSLFGAEQNDGHGNWESRADRGRAAALGWVTDNHDRSVPVDMILLGKGALQEIYIHINFEIPGDASPVLHELGKFCRLSPACC